MSLRPIGWYWLICLLIAHPKSQFREDTWWRKSVWWFGTVFIFPDIWIFNLYIYIYGIMIPTDEIICFRGVCQPPTSRGSWKSHLIPLNHDFPCGFPYGFPNNRNDVNIISVVIQLSRTSQSLAVESGGSLNWCAAWKEFLESRHFSSVENPNDGGWFRYFMYFL